MAQAVLQGVVRLFFQRQYNCIAKSQVMAQAMLQGVVRFFFFNDSITVLLSVKLSNGTSSATRCSQIIFFQTTIQLYC